MKESVKLEKLEPDGKTTISLLKSSRKRLKSYGKKGQTYDDILRWLMDTADIVNEEEKG